ncbi:small subunit processome component 20 homolog isoform X1 [Asparagus officinalis]|uniref:small subunit processome component 20 homolog isoform X1 n=1 Tax=Asparagus officinalis TaxID=4686 RepID=UPI00098E7122|nr:small subunit processome component 20 homolog isoform X1 [Asparagus officinalis]
MATSRSQSVKCLDTSSGPKRFTFKSISQRIKEIDINVYKSLDPLRSEPKSSSFFLDSLLYWRELNTAEDFISFYEEMMPLVQTMPQILFHKDKIFSELIRRVNMKAQLSLEPILMLIASLSRDILQEFLPFLQRLTDCVVNLLTNGGRYNPNILEQVFTSWQYIMMYLQKYLVKDVVDVLKITTRLRYFENDYVPDFMAEAVSFLLRNSSAMELKKGLRMIVLEVAESPSAIKKRGATALLFYVLKGTSSRLHSRAEKVFRWLIDKSFLSLSDESLEGLEAVLEVSSDVIKRIFKELDPTEFGMVYKCLYEETSSSINDGCLMHLNRLLSLLTTTIYQSNNTQIYDSETLLELVRLLIRSYIVPVENMKSEEHFSEVLNGILELTLCLLDNPLISDDLSSISLDYAPVFRLKNSGLSFVNRLLLKNPCVVHAFRHHIISAMANLIEESPEVVLFSIIKFIEGQEKLQPFNSLAGIPSEEMLKLCNYFKEILFFWVKLLGRCTTDNSLSDAPVTISNMAVLWGVLSCYPHFQHLHDNVSPIIDLIVALDQVLETEADNIAGIPKSTWQSLLGAALISYHKLLLVTKTGLSETSTFLRLAKRYKSSSQVLFAVAEFLDSFIGGISKSEAHASQNIRDLDTNEAVIATNIFSDNLSLPNKEIRMSTLRILSHYAPLGGPSATSYEPPHKKLKTEESGSCSELSPSSNVVDLLLLVEATPLSISSSRKIVNLISRLQKGLSSARVNHAYLPLVLNGLIGTLHNRLSYLWQPASECLAVLLGRYKDLVWNKFVQHLENYQLRFLSSSDELVKINSESPQEKNLVDCFKLFLAPDFDNTPCVTVINQFLKSLQEVHDLAESRSRQLIPLFLKFLGYADDSRSSVEPFSGHSCSGKQWRLVLKEWLNLLKSMRDVRSLYQSQFLKEVLSNRLLGEIDSDIQLKVLDCLLNWKDEFLTPYGQHLKNLIISKNLREELAIWSASKDSQCIQECHRGPMIPILIRLLTPKVRNLKTLGSRKHTGVSHRRAVLCFLAQLDVDELHLFFALLLNPLLRCPLASDVTNTQFAIPFEKDIEPRSSVLVKCSDTVALGNFSWKKSYGFLHVVEDILRTFDEFHIRPFLNLLMRVVAQILESCMLSLTSDSKVHGTDIPLLSANMLQSPADQASDEFCFSLEVSTSNKQYKELRSLCLKIISFALNKYDSHDFGSDFWDTFFNSVKPLTDCFKQEAASSEKASSLFSCFLAMSRSRTLVSLLDREAKLIPKIFSILTVRTASDDIISSVLNFVENLLILDNESNDQEENPVKGVLLPHLAVLIDCFHGLLQSHKEISRKSPMSSGKTELRIFKLLVKYVNDPVVAEKFVDILLPIFKKKALNSDECLDGLHIIRQILPVLSDKTTGKILSAVNPLLVSCGLNMRLCICDILDGLSLIDPSLAFLARLLRELNAVSYLEINELDYDTRISAYNSIRPDIFSSFMEEHALTVLSHCIYDMSSEELILRQSASKSLLSFIRFAASVLDSNGEERSPGELLEGKTYPILEITNTSFTWTKACIQRIVKKTFLQNIGDAMSKDISMQKEWIDLFRDMVNHLHQIPALNSFRSLCSEDPEVDFFNNIVHLQTHRRGRALSRFRSAISAGSLPENITIKIFVPLFFNMMLDVKAGKGEHLRNACLTTLASISGQMHWENYRVFLMRCFKEIKFKPDKGKIMIRLICEVLDMFHFFGANSSLHVKDGRKEDVNNESTEDNLSVAWVYCPESNVPLEIQDCLQKVVFPKLTKLLKSDSEKVNVNFSLAALKLLKLLPKETMEAQLPSILHRICNFLKNRLESIRDEARSALAACAKELGMEGFYLIVKVLKATLKRGFELHVLGYTLNFILSKMLENSSVGKLDYCLEELLSIAENDILGHVAEEKEVGKIASKMKETRKRKSFETLKLISQSITFRTHARKLLSPIKEHLQKHLTPGAKSKLEQMLSHIALGIECNPSTKPDELFIFVYGLIEDGITGSGCHNGSENLTNKTSIQELSDKRNTLSPKRSKNDHLIIVFALGVLNNRLKNMKLDKNDEQLLSMLDPFIVLLGNCLNSKYEDILSSAFRCLAPLIKLPLPSLEAQADNIKILLLDIAQKSSNATNPLVQSCLKLLTVLLRSTRISLSQDQLHILIQFPMFVDLMADPSPVALSLLKSIVGRKLVAHEIYDVILQVAEVMVTSQSEPIRRKCSKILLQFLLDYQLSDKRLQQHMDFLLTNLNYEHSSGRESVLEMLHAVLMKFPRNVIDNQAQTFFLHLVVALANEREQKVRSMVSTVIRELIARTSSNALNLILDYSLSWYMGEKQHLWSAAAQVLGLLVEVLKKGFQKHIPSVLQVARNIFTLSINASSIKGFNFSNEPAIPFWKEAYYSLIMFEAILLPFPQLYFDSDLEDIWEMILKFLLHPHVWLRNISNRLVALNFSAVSEAGRVIHDDLGEGPSYLANPSRLCLISASLLNQLKTQISDDGAIINIITQNFAFSICHLHSFTKKRSNLVPHEFWSTLGHRDQTSYLEAFQLLGSSKAKDIFMLATIDTSQAPKGADHSDEYSTKNLQSLLVAPLLKRMGKIAMEMEDIQMKIVFNCFRLISSQMGSEDCKDYAFYLLIPLYKACEGFMGKIVSDDIKQLAEEVRGNVRDIIGVDNFVQVYNEIRKKLKGKRDKRKYDQKLLAVVNPMRHAKRKLRLAAKHRAHKKRKITAMKMIKLRR